MTVFGIVASATSGLDINSMKMLKQPGSNLIQLCFIFPPFKDENKPQDPKNFIAMLKGLTAKQYKRCSSTTGKA